MKTEKSLLQRVPSRISKRRAMIHTVEETVEHHYLVKAAWGVDTISPVALKRHKLAISVGAENQRLDKEIFAMLLEAERNKYAAYFRSSYPSVNSTFQGGVFNG